VIATVDIEIPIATTPGGANVGVGFSRRAPAKAGCHPKVDKNALEAGSYSRLQRFFVSSVDTGSET
jgi:hypothetical protein